MGTLTTPASDTATDTVALAELGKFFSLFQDRAARGDARLMPMFSGRVDAAWHRLAENPDVYGAFCRAHASGPVVHEPGVGSGPVDWIDAYAAAYGPLPDIWFADATGSVDEAACAAYREHGTVTASWNCGPAGGGSGDDAAPADTRDVARQ